jgi:uncharacterized protein (UPF0332 family)
MGTIQPSNLAERLLAKAQIKLGAARQLLADGFFEDSASRAYYAMFHAARAALTKIGVNPRTHEGTVSEFGKRLVLEGVFPRDLGRSLAEAKAARETYEYSATAEMGREEAETLLKDAERFVSLVRSKLKTLKPPTEPSTRERTGRVP